MTPQHHGVEQERQEIDRSEEPGGQQMLCIVHDKAGQELARVSPRLISVNMDPGH